MAMSLVDRILEMLSDGEWHSVKEILAEANNKPLVTLQSINFLNHYDFIQIDRAEGKVKLLPSVKEFLDKIKEMQENGRV